MVTMHPVGGSRCRSMTELALNYPRQDLVWMPILAHSAPCDEAIRPDEQRAVGLDTFRCRPIPVRVVDVAPPPIR